MISLTPFLNAPAGRTFKGVSDSTGQRTLALHRVISVLMQGIALHGLRYDETAFRIFQDAVWKMRASFDNSIDEDTAMLMAGAVIRLLEEHNEAAQIHLRDRESQLAGITGILCETLLDVTRAGEQSVAQVRDIASELSQSPGSAAIGAIRLRLDTCMAEIRAKARLSGASGFGSEAQQGEIDSVTGLLDAGCAIEALARIWQKRSDHYLGLFALEYLETINQRFGFKTGDELLSILSQQVGQHMGELDQLFRWRGPCLAALVHRKMPESLVATEMGRIIPPRLEKATFLREREAMVRVSTSWTMIRLDETGSLDEAIARMNEFSGNRSRFVRQVGAGG